jgi:SAM-dependent methyltransferase
MDSSKLFDRYADHTDGKRLIAEAIQSVVSPQPTLVVDVGSGSGEIAQHLAGWAKEVIAIEPSRDLAQQIRDRAVRNLRVIESTIQDTADPPVADLAVMSYFLDVIDESIWGPVLEKISSMLQAGKPILAVSYLEGCDWDVFSQVVHTLYGTRRSGGYARGLFRLRRIGWDVHVLRILDTRIFGEDIAQLSEVLEFFYKDTLEQYRAARDVLKQVLSGLVDDPDRPSLVVKEVLFEIFRAGETPRLRGH